MATEVKENPKFEKLAGELEAWSILEIAQFGKYLQDRWGVSAAPVAVAASPGGAGGAAPAEAEEKTEFTVVLKALKILGALIGGRAMSADDVTSLARLPGRPQLQAMIVGSLQAPLAQVVGVLTAAQGNLVRVLVARGSQ